MIITTALVLLLAGCLQALTAGSIQKDQLPHIEVTELSESFDAFLAYEATLRAPVGAVIETERRTR